MSLVEHARRELDLLGEEPAFATSLVATVAAFTSFPHSGGSQFEAVRLLSRLLNRQALTPLTADPAEWEDRTEMSGTPWWQNNRDSRAMSHDGGRTFWMVDDGEGPKVQTSAAPPWWLDRLRREHDLTPASAEVAVWDYLNAGPLDDNDRKTLDGFDPGPGGRDAYCVQRWGAHGALVAGLLYEPPPVDTAIDA